MVFIISYFNLVFAKPLYPKMPFLRRQAFNQHSEGQDYQPAVDATEPDDSISQESNHTSVDRIARNTHPCVKRVVREFDACRKHLVDKVQCKRRHPTCNHVVRTHGTPKCQPVYGFRNATFVAKCPSLPTDCQCAV